MNCALSSPHHTTHRNRSWNPNIVQGTKHVSRSSMIERVPPRCEWPSRHQHDPSHTHGLWFDRLSRKATFRIQAKILLFDRLSIGNTRPLRKTSNNRLSEHVARASVWLPRTLCSCKRQPRGCPSFKLECEPCEECAPSWNRNLMTKNYRKCCQKLF